MKAPAFDYVRADSLPQVLELLDRHGDDARLLAGGQTLLATLNMRLSEPALLIDINGLAELQGIRLDGRVLRIGALATHAEIERSALVAEHAPMLAQAAPHIGHRAIRNLGTLGGSLAYADPAAEWPACMLALEATFVLHGRGGERRVAAAAFFHGVYATAMHDGEVLIAAEVPLPEAGERQVFDELSRRHGDYAIAGLAARAVVRDHRVSGLRLAFFAVFDRPVRTRKAESLAEGRSVDDALLTAVADSVASEIDTMADLTSTAETKRHLATVLTRRALRKLVA